MKVRIYSTISVPLETKQLIRHIQRAEQLTVSINLKVRDVLCRMIDQSNL